VNAIILTNLESEADMADDGQRSKGWNRDNRLRKISLLQATVSPILEVGNCRLTHFRKRRGLQHHSSVDLRTEGLLFLVMSVGCSILLTIF
jgi:hypothetical protein